MSGFYKGPSEDFYGASLKNFRVHPFTAFSDFRTPWNKGLLGFDTNTSGLHLWFMQADGGVTNDWIKVPRLDKDESVTGNYTFARTGSNVAPFTLASNLTGVVQYLNASTLTGYAATSNPAGTALAGVIPVYDTGGRLRGGSPTATDHFTTKGYVDAVAAGALALPPAQAATVSAIADLSNASVVIDGITLVANQYVAVKDNASPDGIVAVSAKYNGLYKVGTVTAGTAPFTRAPEADTGAELAAGRTVFVEAGTVNIGTTWQQITPTPTLGTDDIVWRLYFRATAYTNGNGLGLTGLTFFLKVNGTNTWVANGILYGDTTSSIANSANFTYDGMTALVTATGVGFKHGSGTCFLATQNDGSTAKFGTTSNHPLTLTTNNTAQATLDTNGKLGLGTTSPASRIHSVSTTEQLRLGYDGSNYVTFTVGSGGGIALATVGTAAGIGLAVTSNAGVAISGYLLSGSNASSALSLTGQWNTSGTPSALLISITDTASNAASMLMKATVGGVTKFSVTKDGAVYAAGASEVAGNAGMPTTVAGTVVMTSGYTDPDAGRLIIGNGTGWKFYLSKRVAGTTTDLFTFTDLGTLSFGGGLSAGATTLASAVVSSLSVSQYVKTDGGRALVSVSSIPSSDITNSTFVTAVTGTPNQIEVTPGLTPVVSISSTYGGQPSITTLGTISTGVWSGTKILTANGGTGATSFTSNGILYGNGTGAVQVTAAGGSDTAFAANSGNPFWTGQLSLATGLITKGQNAVEMRPFGTNAGNTAEARWLELAANGTNYVGFKAPDDISANAIWTLPAADGAGNQYVLVTNGSKVLSFALLTTLGVVTSGSIASGFGNINIGISTLTAGVSILTSLTTQGITVSGLSASQYVKTDGGRILVSVSTIPSSDINNTSFAGAITGTPDRITIGGTLTAPTVNIATNYAGQASITQVGTLTTGAIGSGFGNINIAGNSVTCGSIASGRIVVTYNTSGTADTDAGIQINSGGGTKPAFIDFTIPSVLSRHIGVDAIGLRTFSDDGTDFATFRTFNFTSSGFVNSVTGYQANGGATAASYLRGNGTYYVPSGLLAADLTGTVATARLGSGSVSASTFLAGDQTWKAVAFSMLSGTAGVAQGGTGLASWTTGAFVWASGPTTLASSAVLTDDGSKITFGRYIKLTATTLVSSPFVEGALEYGATSKRLNFTRSNGSANARHEVTLKRTFVIGDGSSTVFNLPHDGGSFDVLVTLRDTSTNEIGDIKAVAISENVAQITFGVAPTSDAISATVWV